MRNPKLASLIVFCFCMSILSCGQGDDRKSIMEAASRGDADAQYELGLMYLYGKGVPQDYAEAMK